MDTDKDKDKKTTEPAQPEPGESNKRAVRNEPAGKPSSAPKEEKKG